MGDAPVTGAGRRLTERSYWENNSHPSKLGDRLLQAPRAANRGVKRIPEFLRVETNWASPNLIYIGRKG